MVSTLATESPLLTSQYLLPFSTRMLSFQLSIPPRPTSTHLPTFYIGGMISEPSSAVASKISGTITTSSPLPKHAPTTTWTLSPSAANMKFFNITKNPGPKVNIAFVSETFASASVSYSPTQAYTIDGMVVPIRSSQEPVASNNSPMLLRVFYPSGSRDPSNKPIGGSQFYATPIPLTGSKNVTFAYSVFFPLSFNWVLGGKLPGLYGGHTSCSGGDDATTCFSTRLMWRPSGAGELYLVCLINFVIETTNKETC
jgi:hypothetical protein